MHIRPHLQKIVQTLVENRLLLSLGLSAACGVVLTGSFPLNTANSFLHLIALERPPVFHGLVWSYNLFLYSTPFLVFSMIFSLLYVHLYRTESELAAGALPPYPDPHTRTELFLGDWRGPSPACSEAQSGSAVVVDPGARPLYRHRVIRLNWQRQDLWADPTGDAAVVRVPRQ
jgi:hypothetical protein